MGDDEAGGGVGEGRVVRWMGVGCRVLGIRYWVLGVGCCFIPWTVNLGPFALRFTGLPTFKQPLPEALFGFDVEGAGEVIENEQFGLA